VRIRQRTILAITSIASSSLRHCSLTIVRHVWKPSATPMAAHSNFSQMLRPEPPIPHTGPPSCVPKGRRSRKSKYHSFGGCAWSHTMANSRLAPRLANLTILRLLGTHGTGGMATRKGGEQMVDAQRRRCRRRRRRCSRIDDRRRRRRCQRRCRRRCRR
jgi:hypothetical protein